MREKTQPVPNKASAVDAPITRQFHNLSRRRRATDQRR